MGGHAVEMGVGVGVQFGVVKIATLCGVALTGPIGWLIFGTGAVTAGIASYYASKWYKRRVCGGRLVAQRCASDSGDMLAWWAASKLGLQDPDAPLDAVRLDRAFRRVVFPVHPDRNNSPDATRETQLLVAARQILQQRAESQ